MRLVVQDSAMVLTGAAFCGEVLCYGNSQGALRAYDTRKGRELWRHVFPDGLYTTPLCTGGLVIAGAASGGIWAFDAGRGARNGTFRRRALSWATELRTAGHYI